MHILPVWRYLCILFNTSWMYILHLLNFFSRCKWTILVFSSFETGVQSQVESYHRLKKWYLMPPCLALSIIRLGSTVKSSNPGKGVAPYPTPRCSSYWKGSLDDNGRQFYFFYLFSVSMLQIYCVGTQLNIFSTTKHPYDSFKYSNLMLITCTQIYSLLV